MNIHQSGIIRLAFQVDIFQVTFCAFMMPCQTNLIHLIEWGWQRPQVGFNRGTLNEGILQPYSLSLLNPSRWVGVGFLNKPVTLVTQQHTHVISSWFTVMGCPLCDNSLENYCWHDQSSESCGTFFGCRCCHGPSLVSHCLCHHRISMVVSVSCSKYATVY